MKLINLLDNLDMFDNDSVIFVPINSTPNGDTEAMVGKNIIIDKPPGIYTPKGMQYLLEVDIAKEVIQVWRDWRNGKEPTALEKFQAILYYANHDAYYAEDVIENSADTQKREMYLT